MRIESIISRVRQKQTFLDKVNSFVSWEIISKLIKFRINKGRNAVGRPAYPPSKMFRIMLLQSWHNLSDRETASNMIDRISFRKFAGFSFSLKTPSYSTICRFRNRFVGAGLDILLFNLVNSYLETIGLITRKGIIVDSTIIQSSRKPRKMIDITDEKHTIIYSGDTDAKWTVKAKRPYYGYKLHMSTDIRYGFITGGKITSASCADTTEILPLVNFASLKKGALILADKGYCSSENRKGIAKLGYISGIMYRVFEKKSLSELKKKFNRMVSSIRGAVERVFGTLKRGYGFYRTKYLGINKIKGHFFISAIAFNLKKATKFTNNRYSQQLFNNSPPK